MTDKRTKSNNVTHGNRELTCRIGKTDIDVIL